MTDTTLDHSEIQAIVRGFSPRRFRVAQFVHVQFRPNTGDTNFAREFLKIFDNPLGVAELGYSVPWIVAYNVALTYQGMERIGMHPDVLATFPEAYRQGMRLRAGELRDDTAKWHPHWQSDQVDAVLAVYGQQHQDIRDFLDARGYNDWLSDGEPLVGMWTDEGEHIFASDAVPVFLGNDASEQPPAGTLIEHFGFADGIASPAVRGLPGPPVEGNGKYEDGQWKPLAAGEFLLGHTDEIGEMPIAPKPAELSHNSTFMVFRQMSQDVARFRHYVRDKAKDYEQQPRNGAPLTINPDYIAGKMVGRRRGGTPFSTRWSENDFLFEGDSNGSYCPLGAHIRRMNPRDSMGFETTLVNRHRLLRRSMTYGEMLPIAPGIGDEEDRDGEGDIQGNGDDGNGEDIPPRGLLFIALNADIARQFEFIQQQWVNNGNDLEQGDDVDPIIGPHENSDEVGQYSKMVIPRDGDTTTQTIICDKIPKFVTTLGGAYFFLPSKTALRGILDRQFGG